MGTGDIDESDDDDDDSAAATQYQSSMRS